MNHSKPPKHRHPWTSDELALLGTAPDSQIATRLGRTQQGVSQQRHKRKHPAWRRSKSWSTQELQLLTHARSHGEQVETIARTLGRTAASVTNRISRDEHCDRSGKPRSVPRNPPPVQPQPQPKPKPKPQPKPKPKPKPKPQPKAQPIPLPAQAGLPGPVGRQNVTNTPAGQNPVEDQTPNYEWGVAT